MIVLGVFRACQNSCLGAKPKRNSHSEIGGSSKHKYEQRSPAHDDSYLMRARLDRLKLREAGYNEPSNDRDLIE